MMDDGWPGEDPIGDFQRALDDGEWRERLAGPFAWQLVVDWHAARRWIRPDDPRLEPAEQRVG